MSGVATLFVKTQIPYTGVELRPHFLLSEFGLRGSALAAFIGPCSVKTDHLVDWEDRLAHDRIEAKSMVHFIGEFFGSTLVEGVLRQRLLMATLAQSLNQRLVRINQNPLPLLRDGDDLFFGSCPELGSCVSDVSHVSEVPRAIGGSEKRKLSVSIVTASPVSQLLHTGINIDPEGAPVPAIGLQELGIDPYEWVPEVLESFATEWESMVWACAKVRPVM